MLGTPEVTFCADDYWKRNPKQDLVIYLKSIFFLEKFVYTDIENSENKKLISRNFRIGCSKAFYIRLPRILKDN